MIRFSTIRRGVLALFLAIMLAPARAETWDANTGSTGPQDGSGTWSTSDANWWNGTADVVWPNLTTSSAVIGANSGAAGTITVSGSLNLNTLTFNAPGSGTYTLTGGTLSFAGTSPTMTANVAATIDSTITSAGLTKSGTGNLTLSGVVSNTSGAMTINRGAVTLTGTLTYTSASTFAIGSANGGTLTIAGGTFSANGGGGARQVVIAGGAGQSGTVAVTSGFFSPVGMLVSEDTGGNGVFTQSGGTTTIGASNLWLTGNSSTLTVSGGSFTAPTMYTNFGNSNSATTITVSGSGSLTATSVQVGNSGRNGINLNVNLGDGTGGGTFQFNTFTWGGATGTATINFNSGTFVNNASTTLPTQLATVVKSGGANISVAASQTLTISNTLADGGGGGGLRKFGAGTLSLTGTNTYTGTTSIAAGSLSIGNALALQNTTLDLNGADAGTVSAISQNSTLGGLTGSRNLDMLTRTLSIGNNGASTTYSGTLSNGALTKIGSGTLTLTASNSYTGATTISAGALALSTAGSLASTSAVAITGSGATFDISGASAGRTIGMLSGTAGSSVALGANSLTVGDATSGTFAGAIGGSGGLTKQGAGTLVLSGSSSFGGGVTLTGGQVQVANANALGTGVFTTNVDADTTIAFNLPTSGTVANAITINKPGVARNYYFQQNQSNNVTLAGNITVASGNFNRFALSGVTSGTFTLTGSNAFSGDVLTSSTNITFRIGGVNAAGNSPTVWRQDASTKMVLLDGASFSRVINSVASYSMETSGSATMAADVYNKDGNTTAIDLPAGAQLTFAANIRAEGGFTTGTFTKTGAGTWVVNNTVNQMTFNLLDGTMQVSSFSGIGPTSTASFLVLNGGTLRYTGAAASTTREFTLGANGGSLDASGSGSAAFTSTAPVSFTGSGNRTLTLTGTNTGNNTLALAINDNGADKVSLSKTGAGTWVVSGSNGYTGVTTVSAGSLVAGSASALGAQSSSLTVSGGVLNLGGYGFTRTGTVSFTEGTTQSGTITNDTVAFDAQAGTVSAVLAGVAGLSKTTSGTFTLSGTNTYSGNTTLSAGQLNINNASAFGTGTFTISGGSIDNTSGGAITVTANNVQNWSSDFTFAGSNALNLGAGAVTLLADRSVTVTSSTLTVGGAIGGAFALTKAGAGTLVLAGANTYAGTTRIGAGGLSIGNALALQNTTLDLNASDAGTVTAISQNSTLGGLTGSRNLDMLTRTLSIGNNSTSTTYSGTLSNGALTKIGSGTLTLTGSNSYAGTTTISTGALALSSVGNLATSGTVAIAGSGATFDISGADGNRTIGMLTGTAGSTVTLGANSLTVGDATTGAFAGSIGGTGGLTKQGAGTIVLSGSSSFGGGVTLTGGQVQVANANALGTGTFTTNVDVDTAIVFNLPTSGTVANSMTINKPGSNRTYYFQQNQANNLTLAGNITVASGNGNRFSLSGASTGTFTLTGSNTFGADVGTSANMTFRIGGTNAAGTGLWRPDGTAKLVLLDGANFRAGVGNAIASFSMESSGTATVSGNVWNRNTANMAVDTPAGAQLTFAGTIFAEGGFQTGTFSKTGAGTWVVSNSGNQMTYNILGGTLQVPSFTALGGSTAASYVVLDGGSLRYSGAAASTAREFTLGANGGSLDASGSGSAAFTSTSPVAFTGSGNRTLTLTGTNTGNNTLAMAINDNGADKVSLTKAGAGTWVLTGSNSFSGDTRIGAGTLSLGNVNALAGSTLDMNSGDGGSLAFGVTGTNTYRLGALTGSRNIATSGSVVLSVGGNGSSSTYSGAVTGGGAFTKIGSGTLSLTGANSFSGSTTVSAGELRIGAGGTTGLLSSSLLSVASGAVLAFNRSDNYGGAFSGLISGSGGVRVDSGFLNLTAANSYTGATNVLAGGTLAVNGALGGGGLTIYDGAKLMGSGTIGGLTTIAGIHAPGNSPGIQTFTDLTYNTGASVQWELWGDTTLNSPLAYDQILVSGSLNFAGVTSLNLVFTGSSSAVDWANSFWGTNQEWLLYDVGPSGSTTGFGNLALTAANWQDSTGAFFQTVRPDGSFKVEQRGTDIYVVYAAVPEPTGLALAGIGTALAAWGTMRGRRRRWPAADG